MKGVPGFLDAKNMANVAAWRTRYAKNMGRDLEDLRPSEQLVIMRGRLLSATKPRSDWWTFDEPALKRKQRRELSALLVRQAA